MSWCSVRCLYRWSEGVYEERITVWETDSLDEAIRMAEHEASDYVIGTDSEYLGLAQAYHMFDALESGSEVFSLVRESALGPDQYLDAFFETGTERQELA